MFYLFKSVPIVQLVYLVCLCSVALSEASHQGHDYFHELNYTKPEAIAAAIADMEKLEGFDAEQARRDLDELQRLYHQGFSHIRKNDPDALARAQRVLELKRKILLSHPELKDAKIIASRYQLGKRARRANAAALGMPHNNWSSQIDASRRGFQASIVELSNLQAQPSLREIYSPESGSSVAGLRLHWDADRMLFTQTCPDKLWNVFEIKLDGSGLTELIQHDEPDLDFFDATYLPDGRIIANSNIGYNGVPCVNGEEAVSNLILYTPESKNIRRLTFDQDANWNPTIMNNGRVMYTRWEYTDLTHYYSRIVMHMNPDGTENKALYGSGGMFPNSTFDIQPLPGHASSFIGVISGHHGVVRAGRLILFDPAKGRKGSAGMLQEIPHSKRPIKEEIRDHLVDGVWPQFLSPSVVSNKYFLVAAKLTPRSLWAIYLVDVFDNITCIMQLEDAGLTTPQLVKKRPTPPAIPDRVNLADKEATFFIQDIYQGEGLQGVPRGTVKSLRIFAYEYAYMQTVSDHDWQGIQSGWDIKRSLGSVPVEEDGSVIFKAPANTPISIQPVDENGAAVQWMRSWVTGQPGEVVSCVGCHENQNQIVIPRRVLASKKKASPLEQPEGGTRSFTFDLEIQPILDRACIACHDGESIAIDFRGGKKDKLGFGTSYINLHPFVRRQGGEGDLTVLTPYEYYPNTSELVRMLKKGHSNVQLTEKEWRKIYQWIGYNAPYRGSFRHNQTVKMPFVRNGGEQYHRRIELKNKYALDSGVDWKKEIEDYAATLKDAPPIVAVKPPAVVKAPAPELEVASWPFSAEQAQRMQAQLGETRKRIEIAPDIHMDMVRIPAGSYVMGSATGEPDATPRIVHIKKAFWMSELEVSNAQMRALMPEHDSKFIDQLWKDHVVAGYPANKDDQPAIRLSYDKAMEYCRLLSEKTGLRMTLPTEEQWEWACRAGSDKDFWFGDIGSDFGKFDNLADQTTLKFAVSGVNPRPMNPNNYKYKHYTYLPKDESVDDGQLVTVGGKKYAPNPFGLYNMHGNVAEWTRSGSGENRVVRGGSYFERPKYSTAHSRKEYFHYQPVFNVGFRVILEEE